MIEQIEERQTYKMMQSKISSHGNFYFPMLLMNVPLLNIIISVNKDSKRHQSSSPLGT